MPGTNVDHPESWFFEVYGTKTPELARYGIDPESYWRTSRPAPVRSLSYADGGVATTAEIDALTQQIQGMTEGRHDLFFALAKKLASHYRNKALVAGYLAGLAGNDKKLQKKAKYAVASLVKLGRL
jgi:hypothetical protein